MQGSWRAQSEEFYGNKTINYYVVLGKNYPARHAYQGIRNHARLVMKRSSTPVECRICSYNKHVEVAHIRGISDFPVNTKLSVVNSTENLVYLCPQSPLGIRLR